MTEQRPSGIVYDAGALAPDARAVEAIARRGLDARRERRCLQVRGASSELAELLAFCGLSLVLGVEMGRQPEEREDRRGVEEERHLDDAAL
jgi:hypothetical protein